MAHDFPLSGIMPSTSRAYNKGLGDCEVLAEDLRVFATRTMAVITVFRNSGAQYGALSTLFFSVERLVNFATVCTENDPKSSPQSSSHGSCPIAAMKYFSNSCDILIYVCVKKVYSLLR
jgi:hypothetical protein